MLPIAGKTANAVPVSLALTTHWQFAGVASLHCNEDLSLIAGSLRGLILAAHCSHPKSG